MNILFSFCLVVCLSIFILKIKRVNEMMLPMRMQERNDDLCEFVHGFGGMSIESLLNKYYISINLGIWHTQWTQATQATTTTPDHGQ